MSIRISFWAFEALVCCIPINSTNIGYIIAHIPQLKSIHREDIYFGDFVFLFPLEFIMISSEPVLFLVSSRKSWLMMNDPQNPSSQPPKQVRDQPPSLHGMRLQVLVLELSDLQDDCSTVFVRCISSIFHLHRLITYSSLHSSSVSQNAYHSKSIVSPAVTFRVASKA